MASQVAAGKFRQEPLINALFKSASWKLSKLEKGAESRICTSKFVAPELALEMLVVFGGCKQSEHVLKFPGSIGWHEARATIALHGGQSSHHPNRGEGQVPTVQTYRQNPKGEPCVE